MRPRMEPAAGAGPLRPAAPRSAVLVGAVLVAGLYGFLASPLFAIREVRVRGVDEPVARRIATRLAWRRGANLLEVEARDAAAAAADEPRVLGVRLVRRLPSTLEVVAIRREPVAQALSGQRLLDVDRQGVVLGAAERPGELPVITGAVAVGEELEAARPGPAALVEAAALAAYLREALGARLEGIHVDPSGERWVYLGGRVVVRWGAPAGWGEGRTGEADARRLKVLQALLGELPAAGAEVDLRDPARATWRAR